MKTFAEFGIEVRRTGGGNEKTTCPRCSHTRKPEHRRDKCLSVQTDEGVWKCHNCGWSGALGSEDEAWRNRPPIRPVYTRPQMPETDDAVLPKEVLTWFAHRGIPEWVLAQAHITA